MARLDRCTKCNHYEAVHRQRDIRIWALDKCNVSTCYCYYYSSNKKFIGKFTSQGIPLILSDEEQSRYVFDIQVRGKLHEKSLLLLKTTQLIHSNVSGDKNA